MKSTVPLESGGQAAYMETIPKPSNSTYTPMWYLVRRSKFFEQCHFSIYLHLFTSH